MPTPLSLDIFSQLAKPHISGLVAFAYVSILTAIFYFLPRILGATSRAKYVNIISLLAEVFVAVGLIGLLSFAGRARHEFDTQRREDTSIAAERALTDAYFPFAIGYCTPPHMGQQQRDADAKSIEAACRLWKQYANTLDKELDWHRASDDWATLGRSGNLYAPLRANILRVAQAIDELLEARHRSALAPLERKLIIRETSWHFILFCAVFAGLGVGMKCARAALQLWPHRQSGA